MAETGSAGLPGKGAVAVWLEEDDLRCSICIGLLSRPTTLPCGHSFCRDCIRRWGQGGRLSCPNCGRGFSKRLPERNVLLELVLERFRCPAPSHQAPQTRSLPRPGLQGVVNINELPQEIERTLETIDSWRKGSNELMDYVSHVKSSIEETFSFVKTYINDQKKMVLNVVDQEYVAAEQKRDAMNEQLTKRTDQLLELQDKVRKSTSLEEVYIGDPIKVNEVTVAVQKIKSIACTVAEFKRNLEMLVVKNDPTEWTKEPTPATSQIETDVAEDEIASSSAASCSQNSLPEPSCFSSAESSPSDSPESIVSSQFCQWATDVTFDPKRISNRLELSEDKRRVVVSRYPHSYEYSAKRFRISQVMGSPGFSEGCHYWEVSTKDTTGWAVGLAQEEIGVSEKLGRTELSWCIEWSDRWLSAWHGNQETHISQEKPLQVGVFLDIPRNSLSFYSCTDNKTCLHTFEIHVANTIYPAFWIFGMHTGSSLTIKKIKRC